MIASRGPRRTLRVGSVPYLVGRPLDLGLAAEPGIELCHEVPARLIAGLRDGSLDVALVSSIELFRQPGYSYVDGVAVAGEGAVTSVQVYLRRPLEEVASVALDPASRTARALVRVVWPDVPRRPEFLDVPAGVDPRSVQADAWLRIGDAALREHLDPASPPRFNPSEEWRERTGLPFVFAVWMARAGVDLAPWAEAFARSRAVGAARIEAVAREAATRWGVPFEATWRYLTEECLYEPGERQRAALLAFRDRAAALGLADGGLTPRAVAAPLEHATER